MKPRSFDVLSALLHRGSGLVIGPEKQYLLETRLSGIMREVGVRDLDELADRLQSPSAASTAIERQVIEAMTTNESFFFRDEKPFTHVRSVALPALHAARPAKAAHQSGRGHAGRARSGRPAAAMQSAPCRAHRCAPTRRRAQPMPRRSAR